MRNSARCAIAFSMFVLAGKAGLASEPANMNPLDLPTDVDAFISHKARCNPSSNTVLRTEGLRCDQLASEEAILRQRYQSDAHLLGLIGGSWVLRVERVPLRMLPDGTLVPATRAPEP